MRLFCLAATLAFLGCLLGSTQSACGGDWIRPDWTDNPRTGFPSAYVFGKFVDNSPHLYRAVIDVPDRCNRVTAMLRTTDWAYVWVDGRQVLAAGDDFSYRNTRVRQAARNRMQWLDLSEYLTPGRHVLAISATDRGFVLDGGLYDGLRRLAPLVSSTQWTVTPMAPATVPADHAIMTIDYDGEAIEGVCGPATAVQAVDEWTVREDTLARVHYRNALRGYRRRMTELRWRLAMMADKGVYIVDDHAYAWGGPQRLDDRLAPRAGKMLTEAATLATHLRTLEMRHVGNVADLVAVFDDLSEAAAAVERIDEWTTRAAAKQLARDDAKAAHLAASVLPSAGSDDDSVAAVRDRIETLTGFPLGRLNSSRHDRLGWLPMAELTDSDLRRWGVRVQPVADTDQKTVATRWRFRPDPTDVGTAEVWSDVSCAMDDRWRRVSTPHNWARDTESNVAGYHGSAWYRGTIGVPAGWAGLPVQLKLTTSGGERLWVNGHEVTSGGSGYRRRTYTLPPSTIAYGGENVLAIRITSDAPGRGLISDAVATCPALGAWAGLETPPVDVLASPLSPCVVLTPGTDRLQIRHGGKAALALPRGGAIQPSGSYAADRDGRLGANWALLWLRPSTPLDVLRPILLVFEANPRSIRCTDGLTEIELDQPGRRIIAVRPWADRRLTTADDRKDLVERVTMWSRAARAVPINYMTVTQIRAPGVPTDEISVEAVGSGPTLSQTVVYDYLRTSDEWATEPLMLAPLPALAVYAEATGYDGLVVEGGDQVAQVHDGGVAGGYFAKVGVDRVSYAYPIEPWPRAVGVTASRLNMAGDRGVALMAALGANSLRTAHTWSPSTDETDRMLQFDSARHPATLAAAGGLAYVHSLVENPDDRSSSRGRAFELHVQALARHYAIAGRRAEAMPFDQVRFDLIDSPVAPSPAAYRQGLQTITQSLRTVDRRHLLYVRPAGAEATAAALGEMEPTGDPLTLYGFRDTSLALATPKTRWPSATADIGDVCRSWWPAIAFSIRNQVGLHCSAFGDFGPSAGDSQSQAILLNDLFALFDQFGMHAYYDAPQRLYRIQHDGGLRTTHAARAFGDNCRDREYNVCYQSRAKAPDGSAVAEIEQPVEE